MMGNKNIVRRFRINGVLPLAVILVTDKDAAVYYLKRWLALPTLPRAAGSPFSSPGSSSDQGEGQRSR